MRFHDFFFKQVLKVLTFYLEKQKKKYMPKKIFFRLFQYRNKKALFTDPIFSEGFGSSYISLESTMQKPPKWLVVRVSVGRDAQRAKFAKKVHKPPLRVNVINFELNGFNASIWIPWSPPDPKKL